MSLSTSSRVDSDEGGVRVSCADGLWSSLFAGWAPAVDCTWLCTTVCFVAGVVGVDLSEWRGVDGLTAVSADCGLWMVCIGVDGGLAGVPPFRGLRLCGLPLLSSSNC